MTIGSRRLGVLVVALLALALAGCSKAGGSDGGRTAAPPLAAGGSPGPSKTPITAAPTYPKDAAGSTYCLYFNAVGDELRLRVSNPLLGYPRAMGTGSTFDPITFPSDNAAYAKEALDAWQSGDEARLGLLTAQPFTVAEVTALGSDPAGSWTENGGEGAAGTIYYKFKDAAGHQLAFGFLNGPPAATTGTASQHRITTIVYMA